MVKEGHKPELIIIAGPNGSGKTSVTKRFLHHEWAEGTTYINPDEVANEMFGDWNSREAVLNAANYCAEWRERCLNKRTSFVFETVMSAIDKVDTLIINGAECEPYLTSDYRVMIESPEEIVTGLMVVLYRFGIENGHIAIEDNKPLAIEKMKEACKDTPCNGGRS